VSHKRTFARSKADKSWLRSAKQLRCAKFGQRRAIENRSSVRIKQESDQKGRNNCGERKGRKEQRVSEGGAGGSEQKARGNTRRNANNQNKNLSKKRGAR